MMPTARLKISSRLWADRWKSMVGIDFCRTSWMPIFLNFCPPKRNRSKICHCCSIINKYYNFSTNSVYLIQFQKYCLQWSSTEFMKTAHPWLLKPNCDNKQSTISFVSRFISTNNKERWDDVFLKPEEWYAQSSIRC